ncbi:hypothetical protein GQ600_27015 [Phytophthora cactorum]|nr:hypothetical protein GQ600_27015 [Phytophthora cactorum]
MTSNVQLSSLTTDPTAPFDASGLRRWTTCGRKLHLGQAEAKSKKDPRRDAAHFAGAAAVTWQIMEHHGTLSCGEGPGRGAGTQAFEEKKDAPKAVLIYQFDAESPTSDQSEP